jgi:hypothetical protein
MMGMESRYAHACCLAPAGPSGAAFAQQEPFAACECEPFPRGDETDFGIPGWDNLWVDLGGEG